MYSLDYDNDEHETDRIADRGQAAGAVYLPVPWIGQNVRGVSTDDYTNSDCGPACLAMWLGYLGQRVTVDAVSKATGLPAGFKYTRPATLVTTAAKFNLKIRRGLNLTFDTIKGHIDNANPVIVLVHYASLPQRSDPKFTAGHWIIVTGYEQETILYNDPLWPDATGEAIRISWPEFDKALIACARDGNMPRQGLVKA